MSSVPYSTPREITVPIFCLLIIIIIWERLQKSALHRINIQAFVTRYKLFFQLCLLKTYDTSRVLTEPIFCILLIIIIWENLQKSVLHWTNIQAFVTIYKLIYSALSIAHLCYIQGVNEEIFCTLILIWKNLQRLCWVLNGRGKKDLLRSSNRVLTSGLEIVRNINNGGWAIL